MKQRIVRRIVRTALATAMGAAFLAGAGVGVAPAHAARAVVVPQKNTLPRVALGGFSTPDGQGDQAWAWTGDIGADTCVRVGELAVVVPEAQGELVIDLTLESEAHSATNRYVTMIDG